MGCLAIERGQPAGSQLPLLSLQRLFLACRQSWRVIESGLIAHEWVRIDIHISRPALDEKFTGPPCRAGVHEML